MGKYTGPDGYLANYLAATSGTEKTEVTTEIAALLAAAGNIPVGAGYEPTIGGVVTMKVTVDAGSDVDHAEVLITPNCTDIAIASQRLANPDSTAEVIKTGRTGATADGAIFQFSLPGGLVDIFVGLRGGAFYTQAAGATVTGTQAAKASWSATLNLKWARVTLGGPYVGAGTNKRYRDIIITGFAGA